MARATATRVHVGTSGWSYPHWKGPFYPPDLADQALLGYYARRFRTVEINASHYRLPAPETLQHWRETVPAEFVFAVKAHRYITHMKRLKDPAKTLPPFLERIALLRPKLGPVLFQLPPRWHCDLARLERFIDALPGEFRYGFEFRDPSWLNPAVYALLSERNLALCIYDFDGRRSPAEITADLVYLRLHGPAGPYQGSYDAAALGGWAQACLAWARQGMEVFCYFDNDEAGYAALNAAQLEALIAAS